MFTRFLAVWLLLCSVASAELIVIESGVHDRVNLNEERELLFKGGSINYLSNVGGKATMDGGMLMDFGSRIGRGGEMTINGLDQNLLSQAPFGIMHLVTMNDPGGATITLNGYNFRHSNRNPDNPDYSSHIIEGWLLDGSYINLDLVRMGSPLQNNFYLNTVPGGVDADGDYDFDLEDLNAVRNNFGDVGPLGDTNLDGSVDLVDLNKVRNHFGTGYSWLGPEYEFSGKIPFGEAIQAPEPSSILLAMTGLLLAGTWRAFR